MKWFLSISALLALAAAMAFGYVGHGDLSVRRAIAAKPVAILHSFFTADESRRFLYAHRVAGLRRELCEVAVFGTPPGALGSAAIEIFSVV